MNNTVNNHIISFRSRLRCLDEPEHAAVWQGQPPAIFGIKVDEVRQKLATLIKDATGQSTPVTGTTAEKETAETALENAAHALGRMTVLYAEDHQDEVLSHKFDVPPGHWQRLRDEALLERAQLLADECAKLIQKDPAAAGNYNITEPILTEYRQSVSAYEAAIVAPHDRISHRHVLTASLPDQVRVLKRLFHKLEDILPQFKTPSGQTFATAYLATAPVINRGVRHRHPVEETEGKGETKAQIVRPVGVEQP